MQAARNADSPYGVALVTAAARVLGAQGGAIL